MEQTAVYNAVNFNWPIAPGPGASGPFAGYPAFKPFPVNTTAMTTKVNFFLCPSDGATRAGDPARRRHDVRPEQLPLLHRRRPARQRARRRRGQPEQRRAAGRRRVHPRAAAVDRHDHRRVEQHGGGLGAVDRPGRRDARPPSRARRRPAGRPPGRRLRRDRRRCPTTPSIGCNDVIAGWRLDKGYAWWDGDYRSSLYNHYLTPNSKIYDCWQSSPPHDPAIKAARSNHPGGVNVLFCDGHVAVRQGLGQPRRPGGRSRRGPAARSSRLYSGSRRATLEAMRAHRRRDDSWLRIIAGRRADSTAEVIKWHRTMQENVSQERRRRRTGQSAQPGKRHLQESRRPGAEDETRVTFF